MNFSLIYVSTATKLMSTQDLVALLHRARENNARLGITGLLLYKQGTFMQAIEGDEMAVRALYAAISKDPRHHSVSTLSATLIAQRQFSAWEMGFKNLEGVDISSIPGYRPLSGAPGNPDERAQQAQFVTRLLTTFGQTA